MSVLQLLFRKWWVIALQGVLLIILSIYIFRNPVAMLAGISFWFGVLVLATGLLGVVSWLMADRLDRAGLSLLWSILTAAFGLLMLFNMLATMKTITVIFGLWMLITGLHLARSGWSLRDQNVSGWFMLGAGVLSATAAIMMIFNLGIGAVGVGTLLGLQVMLTGVALALLSLAKRVLAGRVTARLHTDR
jgi:uncharacterized membrane protein HdeD (DUF308 family)